MGAVAAAACCSVPVLNPATLPRLPLSCLLLLLHLQGGDSAPNSKNTGPSSAGKAGGGSKAINVLLPLLLIIAAVLVNMYLSKQQ